MINIDLIYTYAKRFAKLAQEGQPFTLTKRYVLAQFFNAFKDKYTIVYDSVSIENEKDTSANVVHAYGPSMSFDFIESPKQTLPPNKVNEEVVKVMTSGEIGKYVHSVGVQPNGQKRYTCQIVFKVDVDALTA